VATRLFVGGLSWNTDEEGLRQAFSDYGEIVDAKVIRDRESGRSRGFGFVTLADDEAGQRAVSEMNGSAIDGRNVRVNVAEDRRGGGRPGPRRDGPRRDGPRRDGPRRDGPRRDGPRRDGPRPPRSEPDVVSRGRGGPARRDYNSTRSPGRGHRDGPGSSFERERFSQPRRDGPSRAGWDSRPSAAQDGDGDWASDRSDRRRPRKGKKKKDGEGRFEDGWGGDASGRKKRGSKRGRSAWSDYEDYGDE